MMEPVIRVDGRNASAELGSPALDVSKVLWNGSMAIIGVSLAIPYFSVDAFVLFLCLAYSTLLVGHSVGMHRMMIHRTFRAPRGLERLLIYVGVLVGVAGPSAILRIHDIRDWAQRQPNCHDFFAHRVPFVKDLSWQLFYRFEFVSPPKFKVETEIADDKFYLFLDRTWRWHQIPLALVLFAIGGFSWVVWGVCLRVFVSAAGHWTITHFCHRSGPGSWNVVGASVQASNLRGLGLITYGECWHNNHHAFPESARIGLEKGQLDPAWWLISTLGKVGLATEIGSPRAIEDREDLAKRLT